jgi:hypothetical protein
MLGCGGSFLMVSTSFIICCRPGFLMSISFIANNALSERRCIK